MKILLLSISIMILNVAGNETVRDSDKTDYTKRIFHENSNYTKLKGDKKKQPGLQSDRITVLEFFLYSCPSCYRLEPKLERWIGENSDKVILKRIPAVVTPDWVPLAKAYYIAEHLGIIKKTHKLLFSAIHQNKKVYLNEYSLSQFFESQGVDKEKFIALYNSSDIMEKVSHARILTVRYGLRGVPSIVINNEYITAPFYNKNQEEMLEVMSFLIDEIFDKKLNFTKELIK
ncbi:MAG TPA: thiol:disulfide interchange protein DsbA/DsbL [Aeromonadales bacterium]|nr:thiol:disulfide interchange protein DsbA/DsbL [Aeromonadales bacterium]